LTNTVVEKEMTDEEVAAFEADKTAEADRLIAKAEARAKEEEAKQQKFNNAVAAAVAKALTTQQP